MFDSLLNASASSASASVPVDPAPVSDPESFLFHSLFTMPINNTISQDFCLFPGESSFDFPLFNGASVAAQAKSVKPALATAAAAAAAAAPLNFYANPLCTPQTPSLDLPAPAPLEGHGFDSCALFLDDAVSVSQQQLIDTPFTPFLDTPLLMDTPLDTPFLFDDFTIDFFAPTTIEPQQVFHPAHDVVPSPASTMLSSPAESIDSDFASDDEFVPSRSAALVSGLKRKADAVHSDAIKKPRTIDCLKKATAPKRFSCIHHGCDKSFARLFNLHTHEKTHDPEKARPFLCSDSACGKSFSRKHDLQRHEASVHKGERNFVCETCTKSFARQDGLRRHLAVKGPCFNNQWSAT